MAFPGGQFSLCISLKTEQVVWSWFNEMPSAEAALAKVLPQICKSLHFMV